MEREVTMQVSTNVIWIDDAADAPPEKLGGKLRSLVELAEGGFAVPPGFGVSTDAFAAFVAEADLAEGVRSALAGLDGTDMVAVGRVSAELTARVLEAEMPRSVTEEICAAYGRLEGLAGSDGVPVAVRSSGVNEDLEGASFAGQYETYLWICGADAVVEHVQRCWAGLFSPEVLSYQPEGSNGTEPAALSGMCVVVQQMVPARCSGVAFTVDPVTGDRSKIVIESCWGLGEGVVKGDVTPDRFRFDKVTMELLEKEVATQEAEYRFDRERGGVELLPLDAERGAEPSLQPEQAEAVARLAKRVERDRGGAPQDLEWAIDEREEPRLLQARPETVWAEKAKAAEQADHKPKTAVDHVLGTFSRPGGAPR